MQAGRSMYVDGFATILGDATAENTLLNFAAARGMESLLLYELHIVHANHDLTSTSSNQVLADFIYKAKNDYGILQVGAIAENAWFFENRIDAYNNTRTNPLEKFDIYNLEFEFWITNSVSPGQYYCTTYLQSGGFACDTSGGFDFFIQELAAIKTLATNNTHNIRTEAYVGWPNAGQAEEIGNNLDQVLVHAYVSDPFTSFTYSDDRLIDFANGNPNLDVSIIFSSEPNFMQTWLENNSMISAENTFTTDWINGSTSWTSNINLVGFTYFTYSDLTNVTLPIELISFEGITQEQSIQLSWLTETEHNSSHFEIEKSNNAQDFEKIGQINSTGNSTTTRIYHFEDTEPYNGSNYFRLKMVDLDGKIDYSKIINIQYENYDEIKVYPSLVSNLLTIEIPYNFNTIYIMNSSGQLMKSIKTVSRRLDISVNDLPAGLYFLKVGEKEITKTIRFVKKY
jgi:hypothetical protein